MIKSCLQINDNDLINKRFNNYCLTDRFDKNGVLCRFLVWNKLSSNDNVSEICLSESRRHELRDMVKHWNEIYSTQSSFYPFSYDIIFGLPCLSLRSRDLENSRTMSIIGVPLMYCSAARWIAFFFLRSTSHRFVSLL